MRNTRFYRPVNEEFEGNFFGKIFPASLFCPFLPHRSGQNVFCSCSVKMQTLETDTPFRTKLLTSERCPDRRCLKASLCRRVWPEICRADREHEVRRRR